MRTAANILRVSLRAVLVLALAAVGTVLLMRLAPGYFDDAREMDAQYGQSVRSQLAAEQSIHTSAYGMAKGTLVQLVHGNLGQSRQYGVPVTGLIAQRAGVTAGVLLRGIGYGWAIAFCAALPCSTIRRHPMLWGAPFTLLLAIPTGAMATLCLLRDQGGPVVVLTLLLAARDFKFVERALRSAWQSPHTLHARAQGLHRYQLVRSFLMPNVLSSLFALATLSLITALSAIVPIEVIFDVPGLGQLAWNGAMNRDLPVLLGVTLIMAIAVSLAGAASEQLRAVETA